MVAFSASSFSRAGDRYILRNPHTNQVDSNEKSVHDAEEIKGNLVKVDQDQWQGKREHYARHKRGDGQALPEVMRRLALNGPQRQGIPLGSSQACVASIFIRRAPTFKETYSSENDQPWRCPHGPIRFAGVLISQQQGKEARQIQCAKD